MSFNSGVPQPAAVHFGHDPISIGFYNVGLQNNFVARWNKDTLLWDSQEYCYTFTENLENDLKEAFELVIGLDALFLCELGSMEEDKSIDEVFSQRSQLHCDVSQPAVLQYCDRVKTLAEYLDMMLHSLGMEDLTVLCHPPYACIFRPEILELRSEPRTIEVSENNKQRFAYAYELKQITTGLDFTAVCCHSPISKN